MQHEKSIRKTRVSIHKKLFYKYIFILYVAVFLILLCSILENLC